MINKSINEIKRLLYTKIDSDIYSDIEDLLENIQILTEAKDNALRHNSNLLSELFNPSKPLDGTPLIALEETIKRIGKDKSTRKNRS